MQNRILVILESGWIRDMRDITAEIFNFDFNSLSTRPLTRNPSLPP